MTDPRKPLAALSVATLRTVADARGALCFAEAGDGAPFAPARVFFVWDVPAGDIRGRHAHRECEQVLVCVHGAIDVTLKDRETQRVFRLDAPNRALHIPAGVWGEQRYLTDDARLMVLASHAYDPADYVVDCDDFISFTGEGP